MDCTRMDEIIATTRLDPKRRQFLLFFEEGSDRHIKQCRRCSTRYSLAILRDVRDSGEYGAEEIEEKRHELRGKLADTGLLDETEWQKTFDD
jgi:hypothetical protein